MAEANTATSASSTAEATPTLVAIGDATEARPAAPQQSEPESKSVSRTLFWIVVALLALSVTGLALQSQHASAQATRITALSGQVEGLEAQLAAAHTQLATYGMQRELVRTSVSDVLEQLLILAGLVDVDPLDPSAALAPELP